MANNLNEFTDNYESVHEQNVKVSGYKPDYFDEMKVRILHSCASRKYDSSKGFRILNFGCGIGKSEKHLRKYFRDALIYSVDISDKSIEEAIRRNKDLKNVFFKTFQLIDDLIFDVDFDLIFMANVLHHISYEEHAGTLSALKKLLSVNGNLYIFEHNPLNPLTRHAFNTCVLDEGCRMLKAGYLKEVLKEAGYTDRKVNYILFFPGFLKFMNPLEPLLKKIPLGAQYYTIAK